MRETFSYATTADLLHAIELVPVWTASLFKRWDDATTPRTDAPVRFLPLHIGPYRSSVERPA